MAFRAAAPEGPDGLVQLLRRPAADEFDTSVELWLDPARHAWPVRLRLDDAGSAPLELTLERLIE